MRTIEKDVANKLESGENYSYGSPESRKKAVPDFIRGTGRNIENYHIKRKNISYKNYSLQNLTKERLYLISS